MGRRAKPAKGKAEAKRPLVGKAAKDDGAKVRDLEKRLAEALEREGRAAKREAEALGQLQTRDRELVEAREQQTATSEILRVISSSPTDLQPVLDTIVQHAVRLCAATFGGLQRIDGGRMTLDAQRG